MLRQRSHTPALTALTFYFYVNNLHHLCLRARSHEDVDKTATLAAKLGATIVRGPEERDWALGYYYVLFEDPDSIRLEVNFVPSIGLLKEGESFGSGDDYVRVDGQDLANNSK